MDWNLAFGIGGFSVGLASLIFAGFQHYRTLKNEQIESAKRDALTVRVASAFQVAKAVHENVEALIRRSKEEQVTARDLRYLARASRASLVATLNTLHATEERLRSWRYGASAEDLDEGLLDQLTPRDDLSEEASEIDESGYSP